MKTCAHITTLDKKKVEMNENISLSFCLSNMLKPVRANITIDIYCFLLKVTCLYNLYIELQHYVVMF